MVTKSQSTIDSKVPIQARDAMAQKLGTFQPPLPTEKILDIDSIHKTLACSSLIFPIPSKKLSFSNNHTGRGTVQVNFFNPYPIIINRF